MIRSKKKIVDVYFYHQSDYDGRNTIVNNFCVKHLPSKKAEYEDFLKNISGKI